MIYTKPKILFVGDSDKVVNVLPEFKEKFKYVLIRYSSLSGHYSIVAFHNKKIPLEKIIPFCYGGNRSSHYNFFICGTVYSKYIFDLCLLNICKNVADSLSVAEFNLLKNQYVKSKFCFESSKFMIRDACIILSQF